MVAIMLIAGLALVLAIGAGGFDRAFAGNFGRLGMAIPARLSTAGDSMR